VFFSVSFSLYMYSKLWGSETGVPLGGYPQENPNRENGCQTIKNPIGETGE